MYIPTKPSTTTLDMHKMPYRKRDGGESDFEDKETHPKSMWAGIMDHWRLVQIDHTKDVKSNKTVYIRTYYELWWKQKGIYEDGWVNYPHFNYRGQFMQCILEKWSHKDYWMLRFSSIDDDIMVQFTFEDDALVHPLMELIYTHYRNTDLMDKLIEFCDVRDIDCY